MFLMADMGGTNIRFALFDGQKITSLVHYECLDFGNFSDALAAYRNKVGKLPEYFVLAVPGPVQKDKYAFVNNPWCFSLNALRKEFSFKEICVVNDFEAVAMAIPSLSSRDVVKIKTGKAKPNFPRLVMGAGTGLGVGILVPLGNEKYKTLHSEGGHIGISDTTDQERKIKQFIIKKYGRASAERFVSGQGLQNIYQALTGKTKTPENIVKEALLKDGFSRKALMQMFAFWGDVAGDLILTIGGMGGLYLSGNFVQSEGILKLIKESDFCTRFENKGRYTDLMKNIPIYAITRKEIAFLGLKAFGLSEE